MTAEHLVFTTDKLDATEADIERWAAERGCIVANIRRIDNTIDYYGKTLTPPDDAAVWTCDIVISEGIED